jgi:hypothetical protein
MNERIKELLKQAGGDNWNKADWYSMSPEMIEKFAELIVRRCAAQIAEAIPDTDCSASGAYKTAKIAAMAKVKDHFGVEE